MFFAVEVKADNLHLLLTDSDGVEGQIGPKQFGDDRSVLLHVVGLIQEAHQSLCKDEGVGQIAHLDVGVAVDCHQQVHHARQSVHAALPQSSAHLLQSAGELADVGAAGNGGLRLEEELLDGVVVFSENGPQNHPILLVVELSVIDVVAGRLKPLVILVRTLVVIVVQRVLRTATQTPPLV